MRVNKVKRKLDLGEVAIGTMMMEFSTTGIARIAAEAGAEFAVFDMEHTGWSMETIRMLMATSRAAEIVPLVRVPRSSTTSSRECWISARWGSSFRWLPTQKQAQTDRRATAKYPPEGRRGVAFGVAHDDYRGGSLVNKIERPMTR